MRLMLCATAASLCLAMTAQAGESSSEVTFAELASKLAAPDVIRGSFTQTREIELIQRPLVSRGTFMLSDLGLYWRQQEPVESVMIADGERLLQQVGDGPLASVDVARNPMVLTFSGTFLSIFAGNEANLRANFDLRLAGKADDWKIELIPRTAPMADVIESIRLRGRAYIEELVVTTRSADTMTIRFFDLVTEPEELSDDEIELYAR